MYHQLCTLWCALQHVIPPGAPDFPSTWWERVSTGRYHWGRANLSSWEADEARRLLSETVFNPMEPPPLPGTHPCSSFPAAAVVEEFQKRTCHVPRDAWVKVGRVARAF